MIEYDLIIVGFGPTGATLANIMGQYGWRVAVIEKEPEIYPFPRAVHADDETLRVFQSIGLLQELLPQVTFFTNMQMASKIGHPLLNIQVGAKMGDFSLGTDCFFYQPILEQILRKGCKRFANIDIFLGWKAENIYQSSQKIELTISQQNHTKKLHTKYLVGCDGANSFVRDFLNTEFENFNFRQKWMVLDTFWKETPPKNWPAIHQQICDPKQPISFIPGVNKHYRWEFMLKPERLHQSTERLANDFIDLIKVKNQVKIVRQAVYTFEAKIAKKWRKQNVFIAGDAAHLSPPFLGQGMCSGIRDVFNLGWKLHFVLNKQLPPSILNTYQTERYPHTKTLIKGAIAMGKLVQLQNTMLVTIRNKLLQAVGHIPPLLSFIKNQIAKKQPLRNGFLANSSHKLIGSLFIQPQVIFQKSVVLLDYALGSGFTLLAFSPKATDGLESLSESISIRIFHINFEKDFGYTIHDHEGKLLKWSKKYQVAFVILRPDQHIYHLGNQVTMASISQIFQPTKSWEFQTK